MINMIVLKKIISSIKLTEKKKRFFIIDNFVTSALLQETSVPSGPHRFGFGETYKTKDEVL